MMEAAGKVLKRAVELDQEDKYSEALVCYQEGIDILLSSVKQSTDEKFRNNARLRITEYMNRAEQIKDIVKHQESAGKYHENIDIKDGQYGCSYSTLFSKFINDNLTEVIINDPYIRTRHQALNLLRFCELLVKKGKNLIGIKLVTTGRYYFHQEVRFSKLVFSSYLFLKLFKEPQLLVMQNLRISSTKRFYARSFLLRSGNSFSENFQLIRIPGMLL